MKTNLKNSLNKPRTLALGACLLLAGGSALLVSRVTAQEPTITTRTEVLTSIDDATLEKLKAGLPEKFSNHQIRFATNGGGWMTVTKDKLMGKDMPLDKVIAFAYDIDASRVVLPAEGLTGKMDINESGDGAKEKLQETLKSQFGITARRETRHTDVLQLTARQTNAPGLKPSVNQSGATQNSNTRVMVRSTSSSTSSSSSSSSSKGGKEATRSGNMSTQGQTIAGLIKNIQSRFDKPIVDHTGLTGKYDVTLEWSASGDASESDAVKQALADQAGLELVPSNEAVEVLIVEKK